MTPKSALPRRRDDGAEMPLNYWSSLSESEVVATLDRITDGIAVIGPDWRFRYLNQPAATMLDRPRSQLIGRTLWSYFHDTGTEHFRSALEACVRDRRAFAITEYYAPVKRWFECRGFPQDENVAVLFRDISDRRLADERLREYSDRMRGRADRWRAADRRYGSARSSTGSCGPTATSEPFTATGASPPGPTARRPP